MADHTDDPDHRLQRDLAAFHSGEPGAREALFRHVVDRLRLMARRMLRGYPRVRRWEDTADVLQNSLLRLMRSLETLRPRTAREFLGLATVEIRRELLDLARHYGGPEGLGSKHASVGAGDSRFAERLPETAVESASELEGWTALHEAAANLPPPEREVFDLLFYQGCTQPAAAELCNVDERTIRRRWRRVLVRLHETLGEQLSLTDEE